jgi:hypothetical protein
MGILLPLSGSQIAAAESHSHFDGVSEVAVCGNHVWVGGSTVTELSETSGSVIRVLSQATYAFTDPVAFGCDTGRLWVVSKGGVNGQGGAVTEVNAKNGRLVRVVQSLNDEFDSPDAIAVGGAAVWITNGSTPAQPPAFGGATGNSVTELNASNGSLVRVISNPKDDMSYLNSVAVLGTHVWVGGARGLTELKSSSGALVKVVKGSGSIYTSPSALTVAGPDLWETTQNSVIELSGTTGAKLRVFSGDGVNGIAANNADVWFTNLGNNSVSEIDAATGKRILTVHAAADKLGLPQGIALSAKDVWVASPNYNSVVELNIATGTLVRVIK